MAHRCLADHQNGVETFRSRANRLPLQATETSAVPTAFETEKSEPEKSAPAARRIVATANKHGAKPRSVKNKVADPEPVSSMPKQKAIDSFRLAAGPSGGQKCLAIGFSVHPLSRPTAQYSAHPVCPEVMTW